MLLTKLWISFQHWKYQSLHLFKEKMYCCVNVPTPRLSSLFPNLQSKVKNKVTLCFAQWQLFKEDPLPGTDALNDRIWFTSTTFSLYVCLSIFISLQYYCDGRSLFTLKTCRSCLCVCPSRQQNPSPRQTVVMAPVNKMCRLVMSTVVVSTVWSVTVMSWWVIYLIKSY